MMPTATATIERHQAIWPAMAEDQMNAMLADLNTQLERMLCAELAKLAPGDRRLFRAELGAISTCIVDDATLQSRGAIKMAAWCDPPKVWLVERGSDDDWLDDEQAAALVKAGAGVCRFDTNGDGDCVVALCDHCHPEGWV